MLIFLQCLCSLFTGTFSRSCCRNAPLILQFYNRKYATRISMCVAAVACKLIGRISIETSSTFFYIFVDAAVFTSTRRNFFDNDTMFFSTTWDTIQQHQFTRSLQSGSRNLQALSTVYIVIRVWQTRFQLLRTVRLEQVVAIHSAWRSG